MSESVSGRVPQFLSFTAGDVDFGLPLVAVREILQYEQHTRVPGTPRSIRGVVDVRGSAVPVLDLALRLGLGETIPSRRTCLLVVEARNGAARLVIGILADAVNEVLDVPEEQTEPPPSFGTHVRIDHVTGVARTAGAFVLLLDVDRVISAEEQEVAEGIAARPELSSAAERQPTGGGEDGAC